MWYYDKQGERAGPIDPADMPRLVQSGQVGPATLVWKEGFAGWVAAGQTELARLFSGAVPALPPGLTPGVPAMTPVAMQAPFQPQAQAGAYPVQQWAQPYAAPTPYGPVAGVHFAGFWIRAVAYFIDLVLVELAAVVLGGVAGLFMGLGAGSASDSAVWAGLVGSVGTLIGLVVGVGYFVFFVAGGWQATPGKKMLGLRVVSETGQLVGFGQALGRYFGMFVSGMILGFGFWMIGWTGQKRGLHDMMAGTRVIYARR